MTRTEIIALLDAELDRLERARDYLAAALKGSKSRLLSKVEIQLPSKSRKSRKQPSVAPRACRRLCASRCARRGGCPRAGCRTADTSCAAEAPRRTPFIATGQAWQVIRRIERPGSCGSRGCFCHRGAQGAGACRALAGDAGGQRITLRDWYGTQPGFTHPGVRTQNWVERSRNAVVKHAAEWSGSLGAAAGPFRYRER